MPDYITSLTYILAASVMRLISGFAVFVGEYSELIEVRIVAILSYLLDIVCLAAFMYYISERVTVHFADFISIGLSTICGEWPFVSITITNVTFYKAHLRLGIRHLPVHVHCDDLQPARVRIQGQVGRAEAQTKGHEGSQGA